MQSGKSLGPDGFPVEFFKKFSSLLSPLLLAMFTESFDHSHLPTTLNQASISLLAKKDKDPTLCESYRPISLLNVDFRILAKAVALHLETQGRVLYGGTKMLNAITSPVTDLC